MTPKDYNSISPSAQSLLLLKGYTNIPYAKATAALMQGPEVFGLDFDDKDFWFWMRVVHFESRYWSIDQLLKETGSTNILELSSGYSWRGLDRCRKDARVHYIDTDLPDVVVTKEQMMQQLHIGEALKGRLELRPLNAVDHMQFRDIVRSFDDAPLTIVNEGLLMYLGLEEKQQLCRNIHEVLQQKGGCWITADVYVKRSDEMRAELPQSRSEAAFFEQHNIEANKFDNYAAAEEFFRSQGFELVKEAVPDYTALSAMPHLMKVLPEAVRNSKEPPPKVQATWMLKAV
ncbi:MAG TPA: class I SAM-dependent methyltransferase [Chitinophagaceae bacterium]|nr:class I SAM-dependent methyltransferase [Chitinophagaceae bacterium]